MEPKKTARFDLYVERALINYETSTKSNVQIDPQIMETKHIHPGDIVRVSTYMDRTIWARIAEPLLEDAGSGIIRLDRFQRQSLKAKLGEQLEICLETEQPVSKIFLQPSVDLGRADAHHIEEHLKEQFVKDRTIVSSGMILFIRFHHSVAGVTYRVRDVEPVYGVITKETEIILEPPREEFSGGNELDVTFEDVGGFSKELEIIREFVQIPLQQPELYRQLGIRPPRGLIFYGPPGTGKTHLARAISNELNASYYYINGPSIVGTMYGETEGNLRKIFGEATHHAPSIIMIDEIDVIAPKRGETGSHSDTRAVTQLLSLMDGLNQVEGILVIGTTNRIDTIDEALRRPGRFDREMYFGPPDSSARREILKIHAREMPLSHDAFHALDEIADQAVGYVGADLMELCRESGLSSLRRTIEKKNKGHKGRIEPGDLVVEAQDFRNGLSKVRPSASRLVLAQVSNRTFSDVAGYEAQKQRLQQLIIEPLRDPSVLKELDLTVPEGVLLHGPSGTGKTYMASAVAGEVGANFIAIDGPELFTKWLGESEEAVRHIFSLARRLAPTVMFFDQLEALAPRRSLDSGSRTTERVINQFLAELDNLHNHPAAIAVLAATNRPDLVDPSALRPGRIGLRLEIPSPNVSDRLQIFQWAALRLGFPIEKIEQLNSIAKHAAQSAEGLVAADIMALCREAKRKFSGQTKGKNITSTDLAELWNESLLSLLSDKNYQIVSLEGK